jgi:hypothetical protein
MTDLEHIVEAYELQEQILVDLEDLRFGEIYMDDETPRRKIRKMKKEKSYE